MAASESAWSQDNAAQWARDYRANNPDYVKRQKALEKARRTALLELKAKHQADYNRILASVKRRMGLS